MRNSSSIPPSSTFGRVSMPFENASPTKSISVPLRTVPEQPESFKNSGNKNNRTSLDTNSQKLELRDLEGGEYDRTPSVNFNMDNLDNDDDGEQSSSLMEGVNQKTTAEKKLMLRSEKTSHQSLNLSKSIHYTEGLIRASILSGLPSVKIGSTENQRKPKIINMKEVAELKELEDFELSDYLEIVQE
jgi:hypothetical protein